MSSVTNFLCLFKKCYLGLFNSGWLESISKLTPNCLTITNNFTILQGKFYIWRKKKFRNIINLTELPLALRYAGEGIMCTWLKKFVILQENLATFFEELKRFSTILCRFLYIASATKACSLHLEWRMLAPFHGSRKDGSTHSLLLLWPHLVAFSFFQSCQLSYSGFSNDFIFKPVTYLYPFLL